MSVGNQNRAVGYVPTTSNLVPIAMVTTTHRCTDMNKHSSRSHAIFIVTIECCAVSQHCLYIVLLVCQAVYFCLCTLYQQKGPDGEDHIRVGKLNLVDLAGSERQSKTGATVSCIHSMSTLSLPQIWIDTSL